ncbi:uncharacterized protein LOC132870393 isoform X2 [Neoarius graeffei]|nr:uncharacterized protein LOC132870393 isoform X2 [Neoarius graeffei]
MYNFMFSSSDVLHRYEEKYGVSQVGTAPGSATNLDHDDGYFSDRWSQTFPGPLLSKEIQKEDLVAFIQKKSQECLLHVDEPWQKEAYIFWMIMELFCKKDGKPMMCEVAPCVFKGYRCLRKNRAKVIGGENQENWCLSLAHLLCFPVPDDEKKEALIEMADSLAHKGQFFPAQICYVVAQQELGTYSNAIFDLIGCGSRLQLNSKAAIREAIERTEIYEYMLFLSSGFAQKNFQKYKALHAIKLAEAGLPDRAHEYGVCIATAVIASSISVSGQLKRLMMMLYKMLHQKKSEDLDQEQFTHSCHNVSLETADSKCGLMSGQTPALQLSLPEMIVTPQEVLESRYIQGELLGQGGFGYVFAGVRKEDGKQVAIKYVSKASDDKYINIPGEKDPLPLEVGLMLMTSTQSHCENVVELLEWFEVTEWIILVLERPSPCMDLQEYCSSYYNNEMPETLARDIMWQVVQAARHCCDHGVLHRDIKSENLLINTETLQVKLIDFGCGDLLKDSYYTSFYGTPVYSPPEWICDKQYLGRPATVWSLGVLLYYLLHGDFPFETKEEISNWHVYVDRTLSRDCRELILWCLKKDPQSRPSLEEIIRHKWFTSSGTSQVKLQEDLCPMFHEMPAYQLFPQTPWRSLDGVLRKKNPSSYAFETVTV